MIGVNMLKLILNLQSGYRQYRCSLCKQKNAFGMDYKGKIYCKYCGGLGKDWKKLLI